MTEDYCTQNDGDEWGSTQEEANYNIRYIRGGKRMHDHVVITVAMLPKDVRDYVYDKCCFIVSERGGANVTPSKVFQKTDWVILFDGSISNEDAPSVIAHEIAHALFGHDMTKCSMEEGEAYERQARKQARDWGFTGLGADDPESEG